MNISFQCEVCSKTLNANAIAVGRVVVCPYCRNRTTVPNFPEDVRQENKTRLSSLERKTDVDASTSSDYSQWRDPTFDPDWKKMLEKFPNFKPNPFGISFPLDRAIQEARSNTEYDEETQDSDENKDSTSSQYSVDDLIKGVE